MIALPTTTAATAATAGDAAAPAVPVAAAVPDKPHLAYLDLFRGISIVQVVLIHAGNALLLRGLPHMQGDAPIVYGVLHIVAHDATIYFAVISGILYGHVFSRRKHTRFLSRRLRNVGLPYLIVTVALTVMLWSVDRQRSAASLDTAVLVRRLVVNLATGATWNTLWYIPVILLLYAISPLLSAILHGRRWRWAWALVLLAPLVVSRTGTDFTLATVVYFAGSYTIGLTIGANLDARLRWLAARSAWLWLLAGGATASLTFLFTSGLDYWGFVSLRESAFYVQRLALAALLLLALRARRDRLTPAARKVATFAAGASFGIFFVHGPLLRPIARYVGELVPDEQPWWALVAAIGATFVAGLLLSAALVQVMRRLLGRRSRLVIGA